MSKAVAKVEDAQAPAVAPINEGDALINMIERAARDPNVDIDKMERLFGMRERMQAQAAKTAYLAALAKLQSELPAIERKGKAHNSKYARFEDFIEAVKPVLAKHGFSLSFRVKQLAVWKGDGEPSEPAGIKITGVLGHEAGHQEDTSITLPADTTGSKNPVQAVGSSISYGKRYVGVTLLGVATEDEDDDGKAAGDKVEYLDAEEAARIKKELDDVKADIGAFCDHFGLDSIDRIPAAKQARIMEAIAKKRKQVGK